MVGSSDIDPPNGLDDLHERAPRKNLLLTAAIDAGPLRSQVRIRNMSETGALLDGAIFPDVGMPLTLRRLELEIAGIVVWRSGSRCGISFEQRASVSDWVAGKRSERTHQVRVDQIQAAIRSGGPVDLVADPRARHVQDRITNLDKRLAEELGYVMRLIEAVGDELTADPIAMQRHATTFQNLDLASQILRHLSNILQADDPTVGIATVSMEDLRSRLQNKPLFKS